MYAYIDNDRPTEIFEFYEDGFMYTFMGNSPSTSFSYNAKTGILTVTELGIDKTPRKVIGQYLYKEATDCFALYENGKGDDKWILRKIRNLTDDDMETFKVLKEAFSCIFQSLTD